MTSRPALLLATAAVLLVALPLGVAAALTGGARYAGKTDDARSMSLRLAGDAKHVKRFHIVYTVECDDGEDRPPTYTNVLNVKIRSDNTFRASTTYIGSKDKSRNKFTLTGKVSKRKASGTFSLKAAAADDSVHCSTGTLTWKATRSG